MMHSYNSMEDISVLMEREETITKIDNIIRILLHSDSGKEDDSEEMLTLKNAIDKEDRPKLAILFEDMVVLLKDDPDNKNKIKEMWNKVMNGYGHIRPIFEILESVKDIYFS
jgi:hypothetical protein